MGAQMLLESPTHLYWSTRGEVACIDHLPAAPEQRTADGWQPIPLSYNGTFQCQHCSPDHAALAHPRAHALSTQADS
jgi:hypothetical protein